MIYAVVGDYLFWKRFVTLAMVGILDEVGELSRQKYSIKKWILNFAEGFVKDIVPCYFFLSFWFPKLSDVFGILSPVLLSAAIAWIVYSWPKTVREFNEETRLNHRHRRNILLALVIYQSPLYAVSVIAVLRNYFH